MSNTTVNFDQLPDTLRVLAAYPHGSQRGTAAPWSAAAPLPTTDVDALLNTLTDAGYDLVNSQWSEVADRRVRFSRDTILPRSRRFLFQRRGTSTPDIVPAECVRVGDSVVGRGEVKGVRSRNTFGGVTLYFEATFVSLRQGECVELVRPPVTDCAPLGTPEVVPPAELLVGDVYYDRKRRVTYLGDDLGEIEDSRGAYRDQVFAHASNYLLIYRSAQMDAAALARSHRAALRAVGADDMVGDEIALETARVTGKKTI